MGGPFQVVVEALERVQHSVTCFPKTGIGCILQLCACEQGVDRAEHRFPFLVMLLHERGALKWNHFCENAKVSEKSVPWIVLRFEAGLLANRRLDWYNK